MLCEESEQLLIGDRLAEALVRNDVRRDIDRGLNCDLQAMFDEALFADVLRNAFRASQVTELAHERLDERESLGNEVRIRHGRSSRTLR